jgi:hypothetical protein
MPDCTNRRTLATTTILFSVPIGALRPRKVHETRSETEAPQREFQSRLEVAVATAGRESGPGACASTAQPPIFDGTTSWAVFRRQFESVVEHNLWSSQMKSTYLITTLNGRESDVLHGIPTSATYEETLRALDDRFRDQNFAAEFRNQLKTRTQKAGESLQDFATAVEQVVHRAHPAQPEDHIKYVTTSLWVERNKFGVLIEHIYCSLLFNMNLFRTGR